MNLDAISPTNVFTLSRIEKGQWNSQLYFWGASSLGRGENEGSGSESVVHFGWFDVSRQIGRAHV